jgi:hypothetical protein
VVAVYHYRAFQIKYQGGLIMENEKKLVTSVVDLADLPQVTLEDISYGRGVKGSPRIAVAEYKALVNPIDQAVYTVVTDDYQLVTHESIIDSVEAELAKHPEYGSHKRTITVQPTSGKMKLEYVFPEVKTTIRRNDTINPRWIFYNSYNGSWAVRGMFGAFRLVCSNGLIIGTKFATYRKEHHQFGTDDAADHLAEFVSRSMEAYSLQSEIWKSWVDRTLDRDHASSIVSRMGFTKSQHSRLLELPETDTGEDLLSVFGVIDPKTSEVIVEPTRDTITAWVLYCIITQFITHKVTSITKQKRFENRLSSAFSGLS